MTTHTKSCNIIITRIRVGFIKRKLYKKRFAQQQQEWVLHKNKYVPSRAWATYMYTRGLYYLEGFDMINYAFRKLLYSRKLECY